MFPHPEVLTTLRYNLNIVKMELAKSADLRYGTVMTRKPEKKTRKKPPTRYHHGDLRTALVTAARRILEREGYDALSLRAAARAAGVSQAAPYHHFHDKEALLAAIAAQGFGELTAAMKARMAGETGAQARLDASGVGYVAFAAANPALFRLMFNTGQLIDDPALRTAGATAYDVLQQAIADVLAAEGRPAADAPIASLKAWSLVHGLAKLVLEAGVAPGDYGMADIAALARAVLAEN